MGIQVCADEVGPVGRGSAKGVECERSRRLGVLRIARSDGRWQIDSALDLQAPNANSRRLSRSAAERAAIEALLGSYRKDASKELLDRALKAASDEAAAKAQANEELQRRMRDLIDRQRKQAMEADAAKRAERDAPARRIGARFDPRTHSRSPRKWRKFCAQELNAKIEKLNAERAALLNKLKELEKQQSAAKEKTPGGAEGVRIALKNIQSAEAVKMLAKIWPDVKAVSADGANSIILRVSPDVPYSKVKEILAMINEIDAASGASNSATQKIEIAVVPLKYIDANSALAATQADRGKEDESNRRFGHELGDPCRAPRSAGRLEETHRKN